MPVSIDEATLQVRALASRGDHEAVAALVEAVEALPVRTLAELRALVAFLIEANRKGMAEVVIERFVRSVADDFETQLFRVETFIKLGRTQAALPLMEAIQPLTRNECMRAGAIWTRLGYNLKAAANYEVAVTLQPDDLDCRRAMVEAYVWGRDPAAARHALTALAARVPAQAAWWSFVAYQAALLGDARLFRRAADRAEPLLGAGDDYPRLLLARAHGHSGRGADMKRLLDGLDVAGIKTNAILKVALDMAEEHRMSALQLTTAAEVDRRGTAAPALLEKCRLIMASHRQFGRVRLGVA